MVQPSRDVVSPAEIPSARDRPVLADTLTAIERFQLCVDIQSFRGDTDWITVAQLLSPESAPLAELMRRFKMSGFAGNRKAASALLLLQIGWIGGFAIASYLACRRVPYLRDYALHFGQNALLRGMHVRDVAFAGDRNVAPDSAEWIETAGHVSLRAHLLESLVAVAEPVVVRQHCWSGFSRFALWAMVTSSWAAQFLAVARQFGDPALGPREAHALFALDPEIAAAAPKLYEARPGTRIHTRQRRAACCLYFKSPGRNFCASCPIVPKAEPLEEPGFA